MKTLITVFALLSSYCYASSVKILFLGDSLTEGYGVTKKKAYPYLTQKYLKKKGLQVDILNGSISGSTTASAPSRLKWFIKSKPQWLFLALGANDGLRGIKPDESYKNLEKTIIHAQKNGLKIAIAGMMVPPNYGPDYSKKFKNIFIRLKKKYKVKLMPFLLKDVAGEGSLNQEDGIHPNEKGHDVMGKNVASFLLPHLKGK